MMAIKYSLNPKVAMAMTMTIVRGCTSVCCIIGLLHRYIRINPLVKFATIVAMVSITKENISGGFGVIKHMIEYRQTITSTLCILFTTGHINLIFCTHNKKHNYPNITIFGLLDLLNIHKESFQRNN